jgi:hypothetical protein
MRRGFNSPRDYQKTKEVCRKMTQNNAEEKPLVGLTITDWKMIDEGEMEITFSDGSTLEINSNNEWDRCGDLVRTYLNVNLVAKDGNYICID